MPAESTTVFVHPGAMVSVSQEQSRRTIRRCDALETNFDVPLSSWELPGGGDGAKGQDGT
jgi:hypothetical protein